MRLLNDTEYRSKYSYYASSETELTAALNKKIEQLKKIYFLRKPLHWSLIAAGIVFHFF